MSRRIGLAVSLIAVFALWAPVCLAQTAAEEPQADEAGAKGKKATGDDARQERIDEYLRKREERRARKELSRQSRDARRSEAEATKLEAEQLAAAAASVPEAVPAKTSTTSKITAAPTGKKKKSKGRSVSSLPRNLARAQDNVRRTELAQDSNVQEYLVMIDEQMASPRHLAAFGSFLAQNGMINEALEYYDVALRIERSDPLLWINAGTLQLKAANLSAAADNFGRALMIDPNSAMAHYNLGSTLNEMNRYEDAVVEYKIALGLDPSLGDPALNPSAAHNSLLTAVKLLLYKEQAGTLSLPLLDVETGQMLSDRGQAETREQ